MRYSLVSCDKGSFAKITFKLSSPAILFSLETRSDEATSLGTTYGRIFTENSLLNWDNTHKGGKHPTGLAWERTVDFKREVSFRSRFQIETTYLNPLFIFRYPAR